MKYLKHIFPGRVAGTPQMFPQKGKEQVENSAGGFIYALDDWARVDRFLILAPRAARSTRRSPSSRRKTRNTCARWSRIMAQMSCAV